ncbi:DUF402 domain-containing protein [Chloroflexota bacterium]
MKKQAPYQRGQTVALREIWDNKVWAARPAIVVQDKSELMVFYTPSGTITKEHRTLAGEPVTISNRARSEWILENTNTFEYNRLKLICPGTGYSMIIFWNAEDDSLRAWYINLEEPVGRNGPCYDSVDLVLDIIVSPDLSEWYWEDEDELEEAVGFGLISLEKVAEMRAEGQKVVELLQSGSSPFNGWENWRPDPSWQIPVMPAGWDVI